MEKVAQNAEGHYRQEIDFVLHVEVLWEENKNGI